MNRKHLLIAILATLVLSAGQAAAQKPPGEVMDQITAKVMEYKLGEPLDKTPTPRQTSAPRSQGWWQAFEHGRVYWSPNNGAHVVRDAFLEKWAGLRSEQGVAGFPQTDDIGPTESGNRYQFFDGGLIYWHAERHIALFCSNLP